MSDARNLPAKSHAKDNGRSRDGKGARRVADRAAANPLAIVAGGLTLGVVVGALLPRSEREKQLLAPIGARLGTGVTAAFEAAREAGKAELEGAGISRDNARDQARNVIDALVRAATSAGTAAVDAAGTAAR